MTCRLFALLFAYLFKFSADVMSAVLCDVPVTCARVRTAVEGNTEEPVNAFTSFCSTARMGLRTLSLPLFASGGGDAPDFSARGIVFESRVFYSFPYRHSRAPTHSI